MQTFGVEQLGIITKNNFAINDKAYNLVDSYNPNNLSFRAGG